MQTNKTKAKLKAGECVLGCFMRHPDPGLAEAMGPMGWDYMLFDGEHSAMSPREFENLGRACDITGVTPIARVPWNTPWMIGQALDTGMQGVQVPMINSGADAKALASAAKYSPVGMRGLAAARAANYGQVLPFTLSDHTARSNAETLVVAQVETGLAVENLSAILEPPEIDVIFVGPTDLSLSLGVPGDWQNPRLVGAFDSISHAVNGSGKALGVLVPSLEAGLEWRARGARYIMVVMEALLGPAVRNFLKAMRQS